MLYRLPGQRWRLLPLVSLLHVGFAAAQTAPVPEAGALLKQTEREQPPVLPKAMQPLSTAPGTRAATPSSTTVTVKTFRFEGAHRFSAEQLSAVLAAYRDKPIDLATLQTAADTVAAHYRQQGWLARVLLPKQDVTEGVVTLHVVEAVFGTTQTSPPSDPDATDGMATSERTRRLTETVQRRVEHQQARGQALSLTRVERGLLLANDLPGVRATGSLSAGQKEGETDLVLQVKPDRLQQLTLRADNHGSDSTDPVRWGTDLQLYSPWGWGESLSLQTLLSGGMEYARGSVHIPLGDDGWRWGVNSSAMRYRVITDAFSALNPTGNTLSVGTELNYPLLRTHDRNIYLSLNADHKRLHNATVVATTSHYTVDTGSVGLSGNWFDGLGTDRSGNGGGQTSASVSLVHGRVELDGSPNQTQDASALQTQGDFTKWRYSLSRQQWLGTHWLAQASWSGQRASKNLDSAEKFSLGGPEGVRAYGSGEGSGSMGDVLSAELRWQVPPDLGCACTLEVFYDWGRVTVNRYNEYTGAPALNRYSLRGHGLSLNWQPPAGPHVSLLLARSDHASTRNHQLWLTVQLGF